MLYLIHEKGLRTIKIGYTKREWKQRSKDYKTHGTGTGYIASIEGDKNLEKKYHKMLEAMGWEHALNDDGTPSKEFFKIPKGIKKEQILEQGFAFFPIPKR